LPAPGGERKIASTHLRQLDPAVRDAIARVPRHRFVPSAWSAAAYANRPLPIGHSQTISQPFVVALMTRLLLREIRERGYKGGLTQLKLVVNPLKDVKALDPVCASRRRRASICRQPSPPCGAGVIRRLRAKGTIAGTRSADTGRAPAVA